MRYEKFKIGRVPILTLIGYSKRGLSRRFVTKDSLDSEWDFNIIPSSEVITEKNSGEVEIGFLMGPKFLNFSNFFGF